MGYDRRPWPGDPSAAWDAAAGAPPLDRGPVPDVVSSFERFTERTVIANDRRFNGGMAVAFGLVLAAVVVLFNDFRHRIGELGVVEAFFLGDGWFRNALAFAFPVLVVGGVVRMLTASRSHEARVRRLFEHARSSGFVAKAYASGLMVSSGESDWEAVAMTVDSRIGDAHAARLVRAMELWAERVHADEAARSKVPVRIGSHSTIRAESVFGPEAVGGYLRVDRGSQSGPKWRLILPDAKDAGKPFGFWEVLKVEEHRPDR
ncbi:hypothetical protein [Glycomyces paridis]|uniref:Uncharacterized protein n=1 Tax=Glycomyces paridis TaxID=2126555 RepID=A0A4S8P6U8_9ACTN|nr:hypothetical protein [Glycomyces paridis]THV23544.1 hypothetical protein E9998_22360 [Glycomyces paridis]